MGSNYPYRPQDRGFDESVWFPSSHIGSVSDFWGNDYFDDTYWHNGKKQKYEGYCTDIFFNESKRFIEESIDQEKSFFAYIATNTPHGPLYPKQEDYEVLEKLFDKSKFANRKGFKSVLVKYLAMIRNIDSNVGDLVNFLETKGVIDDTIIIFLTDNGSTMGKSYFNAGMRGMKTELWDGVKISFDKKNKFMQPKNVAEYILSHLDLPKEMFVKEVTFFPKNDWH